MSWQEALIHAAILVFIWRVYDEVRDVKRILKRNETERR